MKRGKQKLFKISKPSVFGVGKFFALVRLKFLELRYLPHVEIRLVHDKTYAKGGAYKRWTDKGYSSAVHKAVLVSFVVSFVVFSVMQNIFPLLDLGHPNVAQAGSTNVTWTTKGDFNNNTTKSGVVISGSVDSDDANTTLLGEVYSATSTTNAPAARSNHTAIWADNQMIVWGGSSLNSGGRYNPSTNTWTATSTSGAPTGRYWHTAVWTGSKMIVWGGYNGSPMNTGGIYDPATNTWTATSTTNAPVARRQHTAVWTGSKMIVWGGFGASSPLNSGGIYDPATDTWTATTTTNAPGVRSMTSSVWTGSKMIVWGGSNYGGINTGGIYDPATDTWTATTTTGAPSARFGHTAVWTGTKMIVWGGELDYAAYNTGGVYDLSTNSWTSTTTTGAPTGRYMHAATLAGNRMIVYGGLNSNTSGSSLGNGGIYNISQNSWSDATPLSSLGSRAYLTGVYTGAASIFWGGQTYTSGTAGATFNTGSQYSPGYAASGTISSLKVDAGSGTKVDWANISWNSASLPANTTISFKARTSDDNATWSAWSSDITQSSVGTTTGSGSISSLAASRYLDITMTLTSSDGVSTPTLNDFTVSYDTLEAPTNSNIVLTKTDSTSLKNSSGDTITGGVAGGYTNESTLRVTANSLTCTGCSTSATNLRPEVEIKPVGSAFTGTTNLYAATAGNTYVDIPALVDGTDYHLQVRAIDDQGRVSGWTAYGANAESSADVSIDQVSPTGTVSINAGAEFATSTTANLTLSASDTGGSTLGQMRFSNDGTTWSDWEAYATSKTGWTLTEGDGAKTVYAQYRDNAGNVSGESYLEQDAVADIYIDEYTPSTNLNTNVLLMVGGDAGSRKRSILRFDISSIPQNSTISSATLNLYASFTNNRTINIHNMSVSDWVASQATWNEKSTGVPWSSVGGDFDVSPLISDGTNRTNSYISYNIKSLAEASYLDSSQYLDMLLKTDVENISTSMNFHSLENVSGYDPYIRINYSYNSASDTITLDTTPPSDVTNLKVYSDSGKGTEYSASTWHTNASPYFEWDTASGASGYKYCFSTNSGCTPSTVLEATNYTANLAVDGNYYFRVRAYDAATNESTAITSFIYGFDATVPGNVSSFTAPSGDATVSSIRLNWSAVTDSGSGTSHYNIERKRYDDDWNGSQGTYSAFGVSGTTYNDTGLSSGYRYNYRIKAENNAGLISTDFTYVDGFTIDSNAPDDPSSVVALACQNDGVGCSNAANAGYEIKLTWTQANDDGVGTTGYKIYRTAETNSIDEADFSLVGYLDIVTPGSQVELLEYYDNDENNDATFTDVTLGNVKTSPSTRLNDFVDYHYRITAIDESGNESDVIPLTQFGPQDTNYATAKTVDVTAPTAPTNVSATPFGIGTGEEPNTQRIDVAWGVSFDNRTTGRTPEGDGSGVAKYSLYRAMGDIDGPTEAFVAVDGAGELTGTTYQDNGRAENTYYYYKVIATDVADNLGEFSDYAGAKTKNSAVPTTPTGIVVSATKGDPNTNDKVGYEISVSFNGSAIKYPENSITDYEIYRSAVNYASEDQWLSSATLVKTYTDVNHPGYSGTTPVFGEGQTYLDAVDSDATTYYYRVRSVGQNTLEGRVTSSLSAIQAGVLTSGWDITPDATAPDQPAEVTVKDIHGNSSLYRNIITWQMIAESTRNSTADFAKYQVYRYETLQGVGTASLIAEKTDIGDNYHVDGIAAGAADVDYSYYVVALDNANTAFKYATTGTPVINNYANSSGYSGVVGINPSVAKPTVSGAADSGVGVSSATIAWSTDQPCDSLVEYRVKGANTVKAAGGDRTTPVTNHTIGLVGLEKGKTYEYRIVSRNSLGNIDVTAATTWREFVTQDFAISSVKAEATTTTATIKWNTNINSDSSVEYKPESSASESSTAGDPNLATTHEVVIKGLKPATTYTYKIRSVSADNYITDTNFATFTTKPYDSSQFTIAPNASNVAEENITATSAKIVWNTAVETDTWVDFGTEAGNYTQAAGDEVLNTVHVVELKNLTPGTTYYYRVRGKDANLVEYTSKEYKFTAVLKPEIRNAAVELLDSYTGKVTLTTNVDTEASVTYGKEGAFDLKAGTSEYKRNHEIMLENLEDGVTYTYYIEVKDKIGNTQKSQVATLSTPIDREGPKVENLKIDMLPMGESDEFAQVIISWNTNKPSTTKIEYDEGVISGKYGKSTIEDTSLSSSHTVIIKDLNPSTTYHFRVAGIDKRQNKTNSQDYTFVTPDKNKSVWQLIVRSLEETFSWTRNVGTFFRDLGSKL